MAKANNGIYCKCQTKICHHPHAKLSLLPIGSQLEPSSEEEEEDVEEDGENAGTEVYASTDDDDGVDEAPESTDSKSTTGSGTSTEIEV